MKLMRITNADTLLSHGNVAGRRAVLEILEAGLHASDPYYNTLDLLRLEGDTLIVGNRAFEPADGPYAGQDLTFDLKEIDRIYVVGAGKGSQRVGKAFEDVLGDRLTGGVIIAKHDDELELARIRVVFGAHPVPDEGCVLGCQAILDLAHDLTERDLVFTITGNGVSALLTMPVPGVSLEDVRQITYMMQIEKGAPTIDLNPIRNNLDAMKGGKISRHLRPAQLVHLIMCDPGGSTKIVTSGYRELMTNNLWLHNLPDCTSFQLAIDCLKKWDCWDRAPQSIKDFLTRADPKWETVRQAEFESWHSPVYGLIPHTMGMLPTAERKAAELGFTPHLMSAFLMAEAREAGTVYAAIADQCARDGKPFRPPCALISGGELLVTVGQETGIGGRNQEFCLGAALKIAGNSRIVIGGIDSDGTDGPGTQFSEYKEIPCLAGGIVDGRTVAEAQAAGVDLLAELRRHNATPALWATGNGIVATHGVSMCDLDVVLILGDGDA
jgi:glycerate 2-kinase